MRVSENWRLKGERYTLTCEQHTDNHEQVNFPPRPVTPRQVKPYTFNNNDEQYAWAMQEPAYAEAK